MADQPLRGEPLCDTRRLQTIHCVNDFEKSKGMTYAHHALRGVACNNSEIKSMKVMFLLLAKNKKYIIIMVKKRLIGKRNLLCSRFTIILKKTTPAPERMRKKFHMVHFEVKFMTLALRRFALELLSITFELIQGATFTVNSSPLAK